MSSCASNEVTDRSPNWKSNARANSRAPNNTSSNNVNPNLDANLVPKSSPSYSPTTPVPTTPVPTWSETPAASPTNDGSNATPNQLQDQVIPQYSHYGVTDVSNYDPNEYDRNNTSPNLTPIANPSYSRYYLNVLIGNRYVASKKD
uniref:Uncharacterized protein n=1 Tax=Mucochytrium quahogii TaxID=96639 RepID=A0A7S2WS82_9STRA|mmetsp:Transcript_34390/g.55001  ORF Transcript_34390/g.55001 Transcript_34390/m.55001 type:complete len:146 (-) Transcript_34390:88-525(-)